MGFESRARRVTFRMLHVSDIEDGRIQRENACRDTAAVFAPLG
jgi:hypothetical protein